MNQITEQKKQLRRLMRQKKSELTAHDATTSVAAAFAEIEQMEAFLKSKVVLAYWSLPDEISTHEFVQKWWQVKKMVLPVMLGEALELRQFMGVSTLSGNNSFGVMEPISGEIVQPSRVDFAIIPGVAFDRAGNRIGRGKGFYDRLMPQLAGATKVGVGYGFQLVEAVPTSSFDLPVDVVICR